MRSSTSEIGLSVINSSLLFHFLTEVKYSGRELLVVPSSRERPKSAILHNKQSFTSILRAARSWWEKMLL